MVRLEWVYNDGRDRIDLGLFDTAADAVAAQPAALQDLLDRDNDHDHIMRAGRFVVQDAG